MNIFIWAVIGLIGWGVANNLTPVKKSVTGTGEISTSKVACIDDGAPITSSTITFSGSVYDLLKTDAPIVEESKFKELKKLGDYKGQGLYSLGSNIFGQKIGASDIVFLLKGKKGTPPAYMFDIYIRHGVTIPDTIKNCKGSGGIVAITSPTNPQETFPPEGFNSKDILDPLPEIIHAPAYVYGSVKTTSGSIKSLEGSQQDGSITIKNKKYPLYFHVNMEYLIDNNDAYGYLPSDKTIDTASGPANTLQLRSIQFVKTPQYSWWTPSCKPAIYLYPPASADIRVQVSPKGFLTASKPHYEEGGWKIQADPTGIITADGKTFPYLYYESRIEDSAIQIPKSGYIVDYNELETFFDQNLRQLGLQSHEIADFKKYWLPILPKTNAYFIGILTHEQIENIEPLNVSPQPDTTIRMRYYFKPLANKISVEEPILPRVPERRGFTLVEWGGLVKMKNANDFTCSQ